MRRKGDRSLERAVRLSVPSMGSPNMLSPAKPPLEGATSLAAATAVAVAAAPVGDGRGPSAAVPAAAAADDDAFFAASADFWYPAPKPWHFKVVSVAGIAHGDKLPCCCCC